MSLNPQVILDAIVIVVFLFSTFVTLFYKKKEAKTLLEQNVLMKQINQELTEKLERSFDELRHACDRANIYQDTAKEFVKQMTIIRRGQLAMTDLVSEFVKATNEMTKAQQDLERDLEGYQESQEVIYNEIQSLKKTVEGAEDDEDRCTPEEEEAKDGGESCIGHGPPEGYSSNTNSQIPSDTSSSDFNARAFVKELSEITPRISTNMGSQP